MTAVRVQDVNNFWKVFQNFLNAKHSDKWTVIEFFNEELE